MSLVKSYDYIELGRGVLTVDQVNTIFKTLPIEFCGVDSNEKPFYNTRDLSPEIDSQSLLDLKSHKKTQIIKASPDRNSQAFMVEVHRPFYNLEGKYTGRIKLQVDLKEYVDFYAYRTGQKLVANDGTWQASEIPSLDGVTMASQYVVTPVPREVSSLEVNLLGEGGVKTSIEGVDPTSWDWVEQASSKVKAKKASDLVELAGGVMTVDQVNQLIRAIPLEFSFFDSNHQLLFYNYTKESNQMYLPRKFSDVGDFIANIFNEAVSHYFYTMIQKMKSGFKTSYLQCKGAPSDNEWVINQYEAVFSDSGEYLGFVQLAFNVLPIVNYYLIETNQLLVDDPSASPEIYNQKSKGQYKLTPDTLSGASN